MAVIIRVAVGSKNPCKVEAVRHAFEDVFVKRNDTSKDNNNVQIVISSWDGKSG